MFRDLAIVTLFFFSASSMAFTEAPIPGPAKAPSEATRDITYIPCLCELGCCVGGLCIDYVETPWGLAQNLVLCEDYNNPTKRSALLGTNDLISALPDGLVRDSDGLLDFREDALAPFSDHSKDLLVRSLAAVNREIEAGRVASPTL